MTNDYLVWSLTFIIHVTTNNIVMWETLRNSADWDCFKTPMLQDILRIQNLHMVEHCAFWKSYVCSNQLVCQKQTSALHSSTQSEIISLDAGLRLDGIHALDLWDLIVAVLHGNTHQSNQERETRARTYLRFVQNLTNFQMRKKSHGMINDLDKVDFISSNAKSSHQEALLYVFEDNEAVIKMIMKGRSPTMRHVSRTHRVALDWLFDRINLDTKIQIENIDTKNQLADILTKGISHVMNGIIFCVCSTSAISVPPIVLKWCRKERTKMLVKKESQQNRSRWLIWPRDAAKGLLMFLPRLRRKPWWKPKLKVRKYLWARGISSNQEQGDLWWAFIRLLRMEHWRKLVFSRVDIWWTTSGFVWMTMIWTLTPPQNWTFRWSHGHACTGWMIECERYWTSLQKMQ